MTRTGQPCRAPARIGHDLCSAHSGLGIAASPEAARAAAKLAASKRRARADAAAAEREEERNARAAERHRARAGITPALRARVLDHADRVIDALLAPVLDDSLSPLQRQRAALEVWSRAFGRPGQADVVSDSADDLSVQDVLALWEGGESA